MKVGIWSADGLSKVLNKALKVIDKKASFSPFKNFYLSAKENTLIIRATDHDNFLTFTYPAQVEKEGELLVDAERLTKLVNSLPTGYMELSSTDDALTIKSGTSKYRLPIEPADEYLEFPEAIVQYTLPDLKQALDKVSFAIGDRDALEGLYIQEVSGRIHYVCSDGPRLALFERDGSTPEALIHKKAIKALKYLLEDEVRIGVDQNFIHITGTNWTLSTRKLQYPYPNYLSVIPENPPISVEFDRRDFLEKLKRLAIIDDVIVLTLQQGKATLTVNDPEGGEGEEEIEVIYDGEELTIAFNIKYLIEALEHAQEPTITFEAIDSDSVAVIREKNTFINLIMPMRI